MKSPRKKSVLITGASSGIGAATAQEFSRNGYFVFLLGRNEQRLVSVAETLESGSSLLKCDLTDESKVNKYVHHVLNERSDVELSCLVNNAGQFTTSSLATTTKENWNHLWQTNFLGTVELTRQLLPALISAKGSVVNVSSTLGLKPTENTVAYSALKAAMNSWSQGLALELGKEGVRVNAVCPGIVDTPIHSFHSLPEVEKREHLKKLANLQPLGRIGKPEEIAKAIFFLGTEASSWTTGAILSVDGGIQIT